MRQTTVVLVSWAFLAGAAGCTAASDHVVDRAQATAETSSAVEPVAREILAQSVDPPGAPGRRLSLVRYTIAPGADLVPHVHPGVQLASIVSGTLTYRVVSGTAVVHRAVDQAGAPRSTEVLEGPAETTLGSGDVVVEDGEMVHFGANRTSEPVVILAALLTETDQGLAVPVAAGAAR